MDGRRNEPNLGGGEGQTIMELQRISGEVIIKPTDKGAAVVLRDRKYYVWKALTQPNGSNSHV